MKRPLWLEVVILLVMFGGLLLLLAVTGQL